jgi:hypothetical protein
MISWETQFEQTLATIHPEIKKLASMFSNEELVSMFSREEMEEVSRQPNGLAVELAIISALADRWIEDNPEQYAAISGDYSHRTQEKSKCQSSTR